MSIKGVFKSLFVSIFETSRKSQEKLMERLLKKCQKYEVISFDVFDTLLKRDVVSPNIVFNLVEIEFKKKHNDISIFFAQKRINAEYSLRKKSNIPEITLEEIYQIIDIPEEYKNELKTIELDVEQKLLHANYPIKKVYDFCLQKNKRLFLISDMYLPLSFIKKIIDEAGFIGYEKLYLSCEYRKTKKSGELFKTFLGEQHIDNKTVLHIGDNLFADVIGAFRAGIMWYHLPRFVNNLLYIKSPNANDKLSKHSLYAFINNNAVKCLTRNERLGYELLGPLVYGFCEKLHNLPQRQNRFILFAARDMFLFKKAYEQLYRDDTFDYFYISRRSLLPVYADAVGKWSALGDVLPDKEYTISQIINYMGLRLNDLKLPNDNKRYSIRKLDSYKELQDFFSSRKVFDQESNLIEIGKMYLMQHGLFSEPIILADVGWHGTTQMMLETIRKNNTNSTIPVYGYYIGCCSGTSNKIDRDFYSTWLFDENDDRPFMRGVLLLESMILAPHGSTIGFKRLENGLVNPIIEEEKDVSDTVLEIQRGALSFIHDFHNHYLSSLFKIDSDMVCAGFENLETKPHKEELESIGELDYENFYDTKIASPKRLIYYLFHWKQVYRDFLNAGWRTGFLYRLLRIRLPYHKIYEMGRFFWKMIH